MLFSLTKAIYMLLTLEPLKVWQMRGLFFGILILGGCSLPNHPIACARGSYIDVTDKLR